MFQSFPTDCHIALDLAIQDLFNILDFYFVRKLQNIVQSLIDLFFCKSKHRSVQIDILDPGVFHVESGSKLQQCRDTSIHVHFASGRIQNTGDDLQNRRFTGTVRPDDADRLAFSDLKINMFQRIMLPRIHMKSKRLLQTVRRFVI